MKKVKLWIIDKDRSIAMEIMPNDGTLKYSLSRNGISYCQKMEIGGFERSTTAQYQGLHFVGSTEPGADWKIVLVNRMSTVYIATRKYRRVKLVGDVSRLSADNIDDVVDAVYDRCVIRWEDLYEQIEEQDDFCWYMLPMIRRDLLDDFHPDDLVENVEEYFRNFIAWEADGRIHPKQLTVDEVLECFFLHENPKYQRIPEAVEEILLNEPIAFPAFGEANSGIYYKRSRLCLDVYLSAYRRVKESDIEEPSQNGGEQKPFPITEEEKRTIAERLAQLYDSSWVYGKLCELVSDRLVENGTELLEQMNRYYNEWALFEKVYVPCIPYDNFMIIKLDDRKKHRFMLREQGELVLSEREEAEYLAYNGAKPYWVSSLYENDGVQKTPPVAALPAYMDYVENVLLLLGKAGVLTERKGRISYRVDFDREALRSALEKL